MNTLQADNERQTRDYCKNLLTGLKIMHLDPVLQKLQEKEAAKVSYGDIISGYNTIKEEYEDLAKGAKDVIAAVFQEFHPVSQHLVTIYLGYFKISVQLLKLVESMSYIFIIHILALYLFRIFRKF